MPRCCQRCSLDCSDGGGGGTLFYCGVDRTVGTFCQIVTIYTNAVSLSRTFFVKLWRDQLVTSMTAIRTNTPTTAGLELDQRRCYSVLTFFLYCFFFFTSSFLFWLFCSLSFLHLVFIKRCRKEGFFLPSLHMPVNHPTVSHLSNQYHTATKPLRGSLRCAGSARRKHIISNSWWGFLFLSFFSSSAQPTGLFLCISFENKAPFWSTVSFLQVSFLLVCILYMFTLYLALPNKETILNVLSLLFYIGSVSFVAHLQSHGAVADRDNGHFLVTTGT